MLVACASEVQDDLKGGAYLSDTEIRKTANLPGESGGAHSSDLFPESDRFLWQSAVSSLQDNVTGVKTSFVFSTGHGLDHNHRTVLVDGVTAQDHDRTLTSLFGAFMGIEASPIYIATSGHAYASFSTRSKASQSLELNSSESNFADF